MAWSSKRCSSRCRYRDCCRPQPVKRPYTSSIRRRRSRRGSCILWAQGPALATRRSLRSERSGPCDASGVAVRGDRARSADHDDRGRDDETGPRIRRISSRSPAALARPRKGRNSFTRGSYQPQGRLRFPLAAGRRALSTAAATRGVSLLCKRRCKNRQKFADTLNMRHGGIRSCPRRQVGRSRLGDAPRRSRLVSCLRNVPGAP